MIKAEVVFDGDYIEVKEYIIQVSTLIVWKDGGSNVDVNFKDLSEAIKYCMEQSE